MRRRRLLHLAATAPFASALGGTLLAADHAVAASARRDRVRPGDGGWPSESEWNALRQQVGDAFMPVHSPLDLCRAARLHCEQIGFDTLMIDTAGRLHIDDALMTELTDIKREMQPSEILFVADAMTGQDAVRSAKEFSDRIGLTGIILTKMDGDARGGAALSIKEVTGQPIKFVGVGEKYDALDPFYPERIAQRQPVRLAAAVSGRRR